ncbi:MAG: phytoene desaturase [Pseudomonadales bacterium]
MNAGPVPDRRPPALVIGSGFGGLAAAVRLGARGYRVTVLEALEQPGGRARVFRQDGFVFDAGPTIVTAPFLFEELWALCGRRLADDVTLRAVEPFYRIRFDDGAVLDCRADRAAMEAEIRRLSPRDVAGFQRFLALSREIYAVGFEQLAHRPFGRFGDMLRVLPELIRLRGDRSVYALAKRCFHDPRLRIAFSLHPLLVGGNPFSTTSVYGLIAHLEREHGVHFAMGGTGRLVEGLIGLIEGQGGTVRCNAPVREIVLRDGRASGVRLADGSVEDADVVVSNGDPAWTYRELLPTLRRRRWTDRRLARARYSMGLFVWYFGTARRYPDVPHHMMVMGPRYRGLLDDIFRHHVLAEDFSLYLHRPTATDASLAPDGCDAFYVLAPVPHLDADVDWRARAEPFRAAIARRLEETVLPDLEAQVVSSRLLTPLEFRDELRSYKGAAFGMAPELLQSAWFRPHNRSEEVEGLYFVGAGTHPGAGLPGVLSSARVLDEVVPMPRVRA